MDGKRLPIIVELGVGQRLMGLEGGLGDGGAVGEVLLPLDIR